MSKLTIAVLAVATSVLTIPVAQAQARYSFDLPAQPLELSLRAVAARTNTNIVFSGDAVRNRTASVLRGAHTARSAYESLLAGTGLSLSVTGGGSFVVTMAAASAQAAQQGDGALSGHVTGPDGTSPITGALVRIAETGETTRVDDFGNFRFPSVPAGTYTLEISYLGYAPLTQTVTVADGARSQLTLALAMAVDGSDAPIVIYGSRSARATALNIQRTAENSADVISADDLGNFTGTTFSEALRRAPGISFERNSVTGDGTNVIVRGMEPDMNAVKLNGLNLPVGNGVGRSADLSNLLADSVSRITIHKSLTPSQDSSGTGGLIEIETMSPLDRPKRYANVLVEGGGIPEDFGTDFLASGTVSAKLTDNFGISASAQYRRHNTRSIAYDAGSNGGRMNFGRYLPLGPGGVPALTEEAVDPLLDFPFVAGSDQYYPSGLATKFYHNENEVFAATISAEWRVGDHTNLKFDAQHSESNNSFFSLTDTFATAAEYSVIPGGSPNAELNLDLTPDNEGIFRSQTYSYNPNSKKVTDTYSLNGKTRLGAFEIKYLAGYAKGTERSPRSFTTELRMADSDASASLFLPEAIDPATGRIATGFAPRTGSGIPLPLLSAAGWALINDPSNFTIDNASGQIDDATGSNDRYTASGSVRWDANAGPLSYLELGAYYERTSFQSDVRRTQIGGNVPAESVGLEFAPSDLTRIGIRNPGLTVISEASLRNFVANITRLADTTGLTLTPIAPIPGQDDENTKETNFAAYVQSKLQFGKLEIIGGVRYNRTELAATNLNFPSYIGPMLNGMIGNDTDFQAQFSKLVTNSAVAEDFLPRILFNYRESDDLIFRGGYFLSVARPSIGQLSSETRISFINFPIPGPEGVKPILQVNSGNPNLKPAITHNFDLSAEYYSGVGIFKLSGFYKRTNNLLQTNITNGPAALEAVTLPDHPYFQGAPYFDPANPSSVFVTGGTPANSDEPATLWGIEAQAERRFDFLPGVLSGFGVFLNYTYTHSSRTDRYNWNFDPVPDHVYDFSGLAYTQQPKHSGTAALTYNKYNIDATLTYGFQSRSLAQFRPRALSVYNEGVQTLDLRAEYYLRPKFGNFRIYVEGTDLLNGTRDPDVEQTFGGERGSPKVFTQATYLGGRGFKLGVSANF